jgi:hypothetical protein
MKDLDRGAMLPGALLRQALLEQSGEFGVVAHAVALRGARLCSAERHPAGDRP